ncbi:tRNA-uridine aminocarboxypropyltransferase 1 [Trichosurus vulpecula]|uniref:tRNA-uridine aminocarboxypropyltransferase 1 n=1 Tax=Trichosurus vulpecula TaxID=9337 RepID=UPI00186AE3AF|nr:tRNA-uridine aminocarboxypropyltransferase 1 [Trichosurus vulpecula]XP_036625432.1 tRNA-uridine aminocarboxypropyltransferase 1 [Trichosurus vulpecula]XP_036625433.1 tRNA-uridine aminocarboxypropyltransferase 1 [Trichosurus vulpecula]XP_036625434.1 tRNA-uridine aminocarboxypropyltransferase 1 [Trichosurus vulpecula]
MSLNPPTFFKEDNDSKSELQNTSLTKEDPLQNLCLASQEVLQKAQQSGRAKCLKCGGSRMFYCYTCYVPVETVPIEQIPVVKLPLKIDIIKHPHETDGKSTAAHAKLLAPEDVNLYTYPCIPEYEERKHEIALVFPGPNSVSVEDISLHLHKHIPSNALYSSKNESSGKPPNKRQKIEVEKNGDAEESSRTDGTSLKKVVFIDSTWNQTHKIISDERLQGLLQVELKTRKTCFWRHQKGKPDTFLSTIEAIYYFLVDYHTAILKEKYKGQYDNLMFFYSFMYQLIKNAKSSAGKQQENSAINL